MNGRKGLWYEENQGFEGGYSERVNKFPVFVAFEGKAKILEF